tara:strand:- start:4358 stop:4540 length:183 start_codon:yes stop_codon:yes gene_type:complete
MWIQIIGIAVLVIISYLIVKRLSNTEKSLPNETESLEENLVFEEDMSEDELDTIDKSIND